MRLRRLEPHEVSLHRELRLRALREAPDSFGETFADVVARPSSYWEDLTRSVTEPGRHVMFLAYAGSDVVGSTYGPLDQDQFKAVGFVAQHVGRHGVRGQQNDAVAVRLGLTAPRSDAARASVRGAQTRRPSNTALATSTAIVVESIGLLLASQPWTQGDFGTRCRSSRGRSPFHQSSRPPTRVRSPAAAHRGVGRRSSMPKAARVESDRPD
jgi:hypothetical protein